MEDIPMFESFFNGAIFVAVLVGLFFVAKRVIESVKSKSAGSDENFRDKKPKPPTQER
jgi:hypothetical protein